MFKSQEIGSGFVLFQMIFEALQSELFRLTFHSPSSKISEFNLLKLSLSNSEPFLKGPSKRFKKKLFVFVAVFNEILKIIKQMHNFSRIPVASHEWTSIHWSRILFTVNIFSTILCYYSYKLPTTGSSHFIFEINIGTRRIRHRTTLNVNYYLV